MFKLIRPILALLVLFSLGAVLAQEDMTPTIELTGVDPSDLPTVVVTTTVLDAVGQPVLGLGVNDFSVTGELAGRARVVSVENITDNNLNFASVLVIDTSSSMVGLPIELAQVAAQAFVDSLADGDQVAIVVFDTTARLLVDFTADKAVLSQAIATLPVGGKTALYDAGVLGIESALQSPLPRRTVVLLSDGAEFGGVSGQAREAASALALQQGVPVYTIGLGFGFDRTYLQQLSRSSNAQFYEAPTPDELEEIYGDLASLLRSQYVVTLEVDVPPDGTEYMLGLQADTENGSTNTMEGILRAPILVPVITLPDGTFAEPIVEPTSVNANIATDESIESVEYRVNDVLVSSDSGYLINPLDFEPGTYDLTINATDTTGDIGTLDTTFEIGALPPEVTLSTGEVELLGEIVNITTVTLDVAGQTPGERATFIIDGEAVEVDEETPFSFDILPFTLTPGEHELAVDVVNTGGEITTLTQTFSVGIIPPIVSVDGLTADDLLDEDTTVTVTGLGQATGELDTLTVDVDGDAMGVTNVTANSADVTIVPFDLSPGEHNLNIVAVDANGGTTSQTIPFMVDIIDPVVTISGVAENESVDVTTTITADAVGQSAITDITADVDGDSVDVTQTGDSASFDIDPMALAPGEHTLTVVVTDENGGETTQTLTFTVPAFPPDVTVEGIVSGQTIEDDTDVTLTISSQTPVDDISYTIDGGDATTIDETDPITLDAGELGNGAHLLQITVGNEGGASSTTDVVFEVALPPTPTLIPTETPVPTDTDEPTEIPEITPTNTPEPTQPDPTDTDEPEPSDTPVDSSNVEPTDEPEPTATNTPVPTDTDEPEPTNTGRARTNRDEYGGFRSNHQCIGN